MSEAMTQTERHQPVTKTPSPIESGPAEQSRVDARHVSPWTTREKIGRTLWSWTQGTIFRFSPRPAYGFRNMLLRLFGASIHPKARIRPSVRIEVPWNLAVGANTSIGDHAIIYCLGPITLGDRVSISQYAHLCAGTHDFTQPEMPLLRPPIVIEDDAWIAADVFVGPGVRVGAGSVVGARSSVFSDLPGGQICIGNPARAIRPRPNAD